MNGLAPADLGFFMPSEWMPHDRCWMAWPCRESLWGEGLGDARRAYAAVARAIAQFEPVTMAAPPDLVAEASLTCGGGIGVEPLELDDSWMRDIGPGFLLDGRGGLAGVHWRFNGWGGRYTPFERDEAVGGVLLDRLGVRRFVAPLVLEGGAIHVDGEGTLIAVEQCLVDEDRNPGQSRDDIEALLRAYLGVRKVIWLTGALEDDETDGHVDNVACFVRPGVVLALGCDDPRDSNYEALRGNIECLMSASDARGRPLEVVTVPQPRRRSHRGRRMALSYVNYYVANGGVVMPAFEDPADKTARDVVSRLYPDRQVVQVPVLDIVVGGGGIHCITLQQPAVGAVAREE